MDPRQEQILKAIVEEYVKTAEPVPSKVLVQSYDLGVSPATVRNEMAALEVGGFIRQPHTSAGRVPTEKGYSYYINKFAKSEVKHRTSKGLRKAADEGGSDEETMRALSKELVRLSGDMAIAAFGGGQAFYTGLGNLFQKPDFQDLDLVRSVSTLLDRFDEVVGTVFDELNREPQVMIGRDNPFGKDTAAVMVKCKLPNGRIGLIGLIGPMRMDYPKNLGLMGEVIEILEE